MEKLSVDDLHLLRLKIFDNAECLQKEATLLFEHRMYSRAYLLAHFRFMSLENSDDCGSYNKNNVSETVDWKRFKNVFTVTEKIASQTIITIFLV